MLTKSRSSTTTKRPTAAKVQKPVHPGEVLLNDFLDPMDITQYRLAKGAGVPRRRVNEIVHGLRGITADTALRLARFFGNSEQFWLNLQNRYDLERERDRLGAQLDEIERWNDDLRPEYDFTKLGVGVRGKYARRLQETGGVVIKRIVSSARRSKKR